jgi:hypothetical protein
MCKRSNNGRQRRDSDTAAYYEGLVKPMAEHSRRH